jgi:hypothetical protein
MISTFLGGIAANPWARAELCYAAIARIIVLFLLSIRRFGERVRRIAERLETTEKANEIQPQILEPATRRPADRDALAGWLRAGKF